MLAGGLAAAGADPGKGCPGLFLITAGTLTFGGTDGVTPEGVTVGGVVGGFGDPLKPFIMALPALASCGANKRAPAANPAPTTGNTSLTC